VVVFTSENHAGGIMEGRCAKICPPSSSVLKQYHILEVEVFLFLGLLTECRV